MSAVVLKSDEVTSRSLMTMPGITLSAGKTDYAALANLPSGFVLLKGTVLKPSQLLGLPE
jgi:hypothetical protein